MIQNNFSYREGTIEDKQQLKRLGALAYGQYQGVLTPEHALKLSTVLEDEAKLISLINQSTVYVCVNGEQIIGMAYIISSGNPWDIFEAGWSYIRMVGVDPQYQGKGIAKALTRMCIDHAKQNNETVIALHTSEFMEAARHVYENLGFKKIRQIAPRYGKIYWLYQLQL